MKRGWLLVLLACACARGGADPREYQGVLELHERAMSFEVAGRLREVAVRRGDRVTEGQVLAVLDDGLERPQRDARAAEAQAADAQLDLLKAGTRGEDLRAAAAQLRAAEASERSLRENFERMQRLRGEGTVPPAQLDDARGQADRARAEREAAQQKLQALRSGARSQEVRAALARSAQAHAALDAAEERLARFTLRAPIAGAVLERHAEPGEVLQPGIPVVTLGETKRPYVDVFVPQGDLAGIAPGAPAEVRVDSIPKQSFHGAVESVGQTTEFTPRYIFSDKERPSLVVRVRVELQDPEERLHAGVPAFARLQRKDGSR